MSNTFYPKQIGTIPSGVNRDGRLIFGRNPNVSWEAAGFGQGGRPDGLHQFQIYLTANSGTQLAAMSPTSRPLMATITIDSQSMYDVITTNAYAPTTGFYFAMREVSVCEVIGESSVERKMMILASQTYPTGDA